MPFLCTFIASTIVAISCIAGLVCIARSPSLSRAARVSLGSGMGLVLLGTLMLWLLPTAFPGHTRSAPSKSALAAQYVGSDRSGARVVLILRSDGTYALTGLAAIPPSGDWRLTQLNGHWALVLDGHSGFPLYGQRPPYSIELFDGDPDAGGIIVDARR